ncbi:MAG TPA: winged helix-turn-helix domain-containing protein [Solirubrobacteraceae bacterium]|nr:winged helix-turn-helix domain-containing protein [Solirubrobacteraceae bacterium]
MPGSVGSTTEETIYVGELEIRPSEGLVLASGIAIQFSLREFALIVAMARKRGAVISRADLYQTVWGRRLRENDRSVDVYVSKVRGKLKRALPDRSFIHTHPGFGYRLQPQPSQNLHIDAAVH